MKIFYIMLFAAIQIGLFAQKNDSLGYLSNLKGKGMVVRKGSESNLKIPFFFVNGDMIRMLSGNAVLVLYNEEEVKLSGGESFTFTFEKNNRLKNENLLFNRNTKQSTSSYKMRSSGSSKPMVFPQNSKIADQSKVIIQLKTKNKDRYFFQLTDNSTNKTVFHLPDINDKTIDLTMIPLSEGVKYTWKIKYPDYELNGELELIPFEQASVLEKFELKNRASYVNAFNYYCLHELFFEALEIIEAAIKAYPEDEYFDYLRNSLF
jgi:hypothetical protein